MISYRQADLRDRLRDKPLGVGDKVKVKESYITSRAIGDNGKDLMRSNHGKIIEFRSPNVVLCQWNHPMLGTSDDDTSTIFVVNLERI